MPPLHCVWYVTDVLKFVAATVEQLSPDVLPLFATRSPMDARIPLPWCGGPASGVLPVAVLPNNRMLPVKSTAPGTISAIAASTFVPEACRFTNEVRFATVFVPTVEQFVSIIPGCEIGSPGSA